MSAEILGGAASALRVALTLRCPPLPASLAVVSSGFIVETVISLTHLGGSDGLGPFGFEPMLKKGKVRAGFPALVLGTGHR